MSKLHIYRKVNKVWSSQADGDGELSTDQDFNVKLSKGSVDRGTAYQIRKGQASTGSIYNCVTGATKNKDATFHFSTTSD